MAHRNMLLYFDTLSQHEVSWLIIKKSGVVGDVVHGNLKQAAKKSHGCKVTLLVPASDVLLNDIKIPAMNKPRTLRAVPFAMEEQLAADLETLHFAIGERYESGELGVAVCSKEQINLWLDRLKVAGIQPDSMVSDINGVQLLEDAWTLYLSDTSAVGMAGLRIDEQAGMGMEVQNIAPILTIMFEKLEPEQRPKSLSIVVHEQSIPAHIRDLAQLADVGSDNEIEMDADDLPDLDDLDWENDRTVNVPLSKADQAQASSDDTVPGTPAANSNQFSSTELIKNIKDICERMTVEGKVETISEQRLSYLAQNYSSNEAINLLQGEFSRKEQLEKLFKPWIPAATVAAIWLFLQAGLFIVDYKKLSVKETVLRQQVVAIYKKTFPQAKNIVDPKRQMESELKKLKRNQTGGGGFISLLHKAGSVLSDTDAMTIKSMRFKSNKLDVDLDIADLQALDELKSRLISSGKLRVEIISASSKEGKVKSRIQIQPKV